MPFCPHCKLEYQAGVTRCPDCGEALVAALEDTPQPFPLETEVVTLCRKVEPSEAEAIRETLEQAGIACSVSTFGPITGYYLARVTDGATHDYCNIRVTRNRLEEATRLLEAVRSAPVEWPEGMEPEE